MVSRQIFKMLSAPKLILRLIQTDLCTRLNGDDLLVVISWAWLYRSFNDKEYGFIVPYGACDTTPGSLISMELLSLWVQMFVQTCIINFRLLFFWNDGSTKY